MPVQNPPITTNMIPVEFFNEVVEKAYEQIERADTAEKKTEFLKQCFKDVKEENRELKSDKTALIREKIENEKFIQLVDNNLQSSQTTLQCIYTIAGAILAGGVTLAFPPIGAIAIGGAALAGGATGCFVAPFVHGRQQHNALIQQVEDFRKSVQQVSNFQAEEEAEKSINTSG